MSNWMTRYAQMPLVSEINDDYIEILFSTRDSDNRSMVAAIKVSTQNLKDVIDIPPCALLEAGEPGTFDDAGVMPSWVINSNGKQLLYYQGWNQGKSVPYRNAIGVAERKSDMFVRTSKGPVLDRSAMDPISCGSPSVYLESDGLQMLYHSVTDWLMVDDRWEARYHINSARSHDGLHWVPEGNVIDYENAEEAGIVRAHRLLIGNRYHMWFSSRGLHNYRVKGSDSYKLGYAYSSDGIKWVRDDALAGIKTSESDWDSEMIAYPFIFKHQGRLVMLYCGNQFGQDGFGFATADIP